MTPEQRFFPTSGNDKLNIHDDVLEGQDAAWLVDTCPDARPNTRPNTALAGEIGKAAGSVHGKKPRRVLPALLSLACALVTHATFLAATLVWLGQGPGATIGPGLPALDLGASILGDGGGNPGQQNIPIIQAGPRQTAIPPDARADQPIPRNNDAPAPPSRPSSTPALPAQPTPRVPQKNKTAPVAKPHRPRPPNPEAASISPQTRLSRQSTLTAMTGTNLTITGNSASTSMPGNGDRPSENKPGHGGGASSIHRGGGTAGGGMGPLHFGAPNGPGIARLVRPEYPREARRQGREGTVILKLSLDASGHVEAVEILRQAGFGMEEAAREAALRSRFRPATMNGRPVACQAILPLHFQLR
ncbi:MAG: TonB family protein [Deltaproteobacteria bacterium]|nr:TonB family protein [Deltaproteobacteria bacterium]